MKSKGKCIVSKEKGSGKGEGGEIEAPEPLDGVVEAPEKVKPIEGSPGPDKKTAEDMKREVNVSDQASKREQEELDKMIEQQKEKNRGGGPGGLRGHILKHHKAQANWRTILRRIVAKTVSEYDMRRPAKRPLAAGVYLPKQIYKDELPLIAIVLDTSGSMGPKEINAFLAEIRSLYNFYPKAQIMVLLCHTDVYYQVLITRANLNQKLPEIAANCHAGGGIDIDPIYRYIKKEHLETRLAAVVILTDGWYCDGHIPTIQTFGNKVKSYALINDPTGLEYMKKISGIELFYTQFT
jgi:predicted metal-dependent peptidase